MLTARLGKRLRDFEMEIGLSVRPGEVLVLLGENGSGKSTTLNMLAGLIPPDDGEILLNGTCLYRKDEGISSPPEERNIGYVFQNYALFPHLSVFENIAFGLKRRKISRSEITAHIDTILADLGISHLRDERVTSLSGGQRQRVALARALIIRPHLLLLDEPLTALDQASREKLRAELRLRLVQSRQPAILVTHSLKDAMIIGDRVLILQQGKVIWTGRPDELRSETGSLESTHPASEFQEYRNFGAIAID